MGFILGHPPIMIERNPSPYKPLAPTPSRPSAAPRLLEPAGLQDMLLYRINRLRAIGGGMVLRYCEGQFGVTRREWVMLALLSTDEGLQPSELAVRAELDRSATSKAITAMVRKGLVERQASRGDHRRAQLRLTAKGRTLYVNILPIVTGINRQLMGALSHAEIALLDSMLERIEAQAGVLAQGMPELPRADRRRGGTRRLEDPLAPG